MTSQFIIALLAGFFFGAVAVVLFFKKRSADLRTAEGLMERFDRFQQQVEQRLDSSKNFLSERVSATERTARELSANFGRLREASQAILQTNTEILDFQKMLSSPSARGGFGELLLENLLRDILPRDRYELQYTLSSGDRADAILKLQDGQIVAIDAKFPLAWYEPLVHAKDAVSRDAAYRNFAADVKKHSRDIAAKYIHEQDHTLSFAFMYIPTEGVYYEIVRNPELWNAVTAMKVYPVSPNSFVPYMYTVLVGLKGMQIEKEARHIVALLGKFQKDFGRVDAEFAKVGTHLEQALRRQEDATKIFGRLKGKVEKLSSAHPVETLEEGGHKEKEVDDDEDGETFPG